MSHPLPASASEPDLPELSGLHASLDANGQKARFGVSYVRGICAQAGVGFTETSPDEDVQAIDGDVKFKEASVGVQVKCTSSLTIGGRSASWPLDPAWIRKWSDALLPVYFVLVIVNKNPATWLSHDENGTTCRAAAFWKRISPADLGARIDVPKRHRLTAETLTIWHRDMLDSFTGGTA